MLGKESTFEEQAQDIHCRRSKSSFLKGSRNNKDGRKDQYQRRE